MAKKKINVRKDYSYETKKSLPVYKRATVQRRKQILILRGPGFDQQTMIEENEELKIFATLKHVKIKILQARSEEEMIQFIKESNVWASGALYALGSLADESGAIQKASKKILIPALKVPSNGSFHETLKKFILTS